MERICALLTVVGFALSSAIYVGFPDASASAWAVLVLLTVGFFCGFVLARIMRWR